MRSLSTSAPGMMLSTPTTHWRQEAQKPDDTFQAVISAEPLPSLMQCHPAVGLTVTEACLAGIPLGYPDANQIVTSDLPSVHPARSTTGANAEDYLNHASFLQPLACDESRMDTDQSMKQQLLRIQQRQQLQLELQQQQEQLQLQWQPQQQQLQWQQQQPQQQQQQLQQLQQQLLQEQQQLQPQPQQLDNVSVGTSLSHSSLDALSYQNLNIPICCKTTDYQGASPSASENETFPAFSFHPQQSFSAASSGVPEGSTCGSIEVSQFDDVQSLQFSALHTGNDQCVQAPATPAGPSSAGRILDLSKMSPVQAERIKRRRQRNKGSAAKCREKMKQKSVEVNQQLTEMAQSVEELKFKNLQLKAEKDILIKLLTTHVSNVDIDAELKPAASLMQPSRTQESV